VSGLGGTGLDPCSTLQLLTITGAENHRITSLSIGVDPLVCAFVTAAVPLGAPEGAAHDLPWERSGEPAGVGICLSGGGLRSASFSLGAVQALQASRGLLYGRDAADLLAVVSGGAYVGDALCWQAAALAAAGIDQPPPYAPGTPETEHVAGHARYLVEDGGARTAWTFGSRLLINVIGGVTLLLWVGVMLTDVAVVLDYLGLRWLPMASWEQMLLAPALLAALALAAISGLTDNTVHRWLFSLVGLAGFVACLPSYVATVRGAAPLSSPGWWGRHPPLGLGLVVVVAAAAAVAFQLGVRTTGPIGRGAGLVARLVSQNVPRVVGVLAMSFVVAAAEPRLHALIVDDDTRPSTLRFGVAVVLLIGWAPIASWLLGLASLHRVYRDRLNRCFGMRRTASPALEANVPATNAKLSALGPPAQPEQTRFPRLLVCATANVRLKHPQQRRKAAQCQMIFSHDRSGLAGIPKASFETAKLEMGRVRVGFGKEPELSLLTVSAMTGAAVAPSMGRMTAPALRPILALANLRLGVWLPNPASSTRRDVVAARPNLPPRWSDRRRSSGKMGAGFDMLIGEFFGLHPAESRQLFVTDGGHYDNLGLTALLRARCATIWCVDAYQKKRHLGRQLENVIGNAATELGVTIDIDTSAFRTAGKPWLVAQAFAIGSIHYPDCAAVGRLIVVKLALTAKTQPEFDAYQRSDRRFPFHSTFVQSYGRERFEAYRRLGWRIAEDAQQAEAQL